MTDRMNVIGGWMVSGRGVSIVKNQRCCLVLSSTTAMPLRRNLETLRSPEAIVLRLQPDRAGCDRAHRGILTGSECRMDLGVAD